MAASFILVSVVLAASTAPVPPAADVARRLDAIIAAGWRSRGIEPSPPASDAGFFRRLSLGLRGAIPTAEEARGFLADADPAKRARAIDAMLASPERARYFSRLFLETLLGTGRLDSYLHPEVLREWLEKAFLENRPWNDVVAALLTDSGLLADSGPANFLYRWGTTPEELAGAASRLFLGVQIQCAQCHDHPTAKWTRADFYGMAAFFGRTKRTPVRGHLEEGLDYRIVDRPFGEVSIDEPDRAGPPVPPRFLGGEPLQKGRRGSSRRVRFADTACSPSNPYFAPAAVNRLTAILFGRGFVDPVDDFSPSNPPSHPEALLLLADDFRASGFDVRRTLRILAGTEAYALSSIVTEKNDLDRAGDGFSHALLRPLNRNQLFDSTLVATGASRALERRAEEAERESLRDAAAAARRPSGGKRRTARLAAHEAGGDAMESAVPSSGEAESERAAMRRLSRDPLAAIRSDFFAQLSPGQAAEEPDENACEESIQKLLALLNNAVLSEGTRSRGVAGAGLDLTIDRVARESESPADRVEELYFAALSRPPKPDEAARAAKALAAAGGAGAAALEDLLWALLNSAEFALDH